jgi:hypothetical protein
MDKGIKFAAIIPNRGAERKEFLAWQKHRAGEMGYDKVYVIDYEPESDAVDIYQRLELGVVLASRDEIGYCSVIESDDYYSLRYLETIKEKIKPRVDLFGINQTMYYHLFSTGWRRMSHPGRSSLFCTTFKTEAFETLPPVIGDPYIDLAWWAYALRNGKLLSSQLINDDLAVGIKHGTIFGRVGGNGHILNYSHFDLGLKMLRGLLDNEAFDFYTGLKNRYQDMWVKGQKVI